MQLDRSLSSNPRATTFVGGETGAWTVVSQRTHSGAPIAPVARVEMVAGIPLHLARETAWALWGVATNDRYTTRTEKTDLIHKQAPIGRPEATCAALIPLSKNAAWWALTQDERREVLEEDSHHIAIGMRYLPAIARRLLHCRDLGTDAPFDFLGFLDYGPADAAAFDDMLGLLRATSEWSFINREIDIRLVKSAA